jgi:hypothetical protein
VAQAPRSTAIEIVAHCTGEPGPELDVDLSLVESVAETSYRLLNSGLDGHSRFRRTEISNSRGVGWKGGGRRKQSGLLDIGCT